MAGLIVERMLVRRDRDLVAKIATDPKTMLSIIGGFGRFQPIDVDKAGCGLWDLFINLGSSQVGGRVEVSRVGENELRWESVRGTRHTAVVTVDEAEEGAVVVFRLQTQLAGGITGRIGQYFSHGIVSRHIVAGLQQLRHHIEHEI